MSLRGEDHPRAKLNNKQVKEIRKLYSMGFSIQVISRNYKVSTWNINSIVSKKTWKYI